MLLVIICIMFINVVLYLVRYFGQLSWVFEHFWQHLGITPVALITDIPSSTLFETISLNIIKCKCKIIVFILCGRTVYSHIHSQIFSLNLAQISSVARLTGNLRKSDLQVESFLFGLSDFMSKKK